ncbi:Phospholipase/Carboxylesterase (fragment) [Planktothrix serta PCC 8927]|uniref:Phospholipase/Carboxylesterase n=1 Tax=Planktothrix serta PCC 8927 TaxID=671068 RepID=A0A7Z9BXC0_9CYAN
MIMNINEKYWQIQSGRLSPRLIRQNDSKLLGLYPLNFNSNRDGLVFIPVNYHPAQPSP